MKILYIPLFILLVIVTGCFNQQLSSSKEMVVNKEVSQEDQPFISTKPLSPLTNPKFVSVEEADGWIDDNEQVLVINYRGIAKVYPLQIMLWHEFVVDEIADEPILVTYCPLCGSVAAYQKILIINGKIVPTSFTPANKVFNSNPLFQDDTTNTYWTQLEGKAITGELEKQQLKQVPTDIVIWRDWKKRYPDSQVLSQNTGYSRPYRKNPYPDYDQSSSLYFPVESQSDLLPLKEIIIGVEFQNETKAYPLSLLKKVGVISDTVAGVPLKLVRDETGSLTVQNMNTGESLIKTRSYWFIWYAFHPETLVYQDN